jgi:hypothetical protein
MIQWTPDRLKAFKADIERARMVRRHIAEHYGWDANRQRYVPTSDTARAGGKMLPATINTGVDFADVERKKTALFYDTPTVSFVVHNPQEPVVPPPPPQPGQPPPPPGLLWGGLVSLHQRLVNQLLSVHYADAKGAVHKALFDALCPAGVAPVQVGFDVATIQVQQPQTDERGQPVLDAMGQPQMQPVDVPIHEEWWMSRISPKALLMPADHRETSVKNMAWIGYEFSWPAAVVKRRFHLPPDADLPTGGGGDDKPYFEEAGLERQHDDKQVSGCVIEYRPSLLAEATDQPMHPQQIAQIVFLDGKDEPILHRPSPHQNIDPQTARLTADSLTDFTIQPLWLRDLSDAAWIPSDMTVTAALTGELNRYRTITSQMRDGNRAVILYDAEKIDPTVRSKIDQANAPTWVPVAPEALAGGIDSIMAQVVQVGQSRENWSGQDYIERDRSRILGIDANQAGTQAKTNRTATEVSSVQRNSEARFEHERQRVLAWYIRLVCLFDILVIRYASQETVSRLLGPEAAQVWFEHKQALAGAYRYEIQMDSGKYQDVEANKRQWLQLINLIGQSPHVNLVPVLQQMVASYGLDPQAVVIPEPPKTPPDPPKLTISAADFNPALPQFPIVLELARQGGYQISDEAVKEAQEQATRQALITAEVAAAADTPVTPDPPQIQETLPRMPQLNAHLGRESGQRDGPPVN